MTFAIFIGALFALSGAPVAVGLALIILFLTAHLLGEAV